MKRGRAGDTAALGAAAQAAALSASWTGRTLLPLSGGWGAMRGGSHAACKGGCRQLFLRARSNCLERRLLCAELTAVHQFSKQDGLCLGPSCRPAYDLRGGECRTCHNRQQWLQLPGSCCCQVGHQTQLQQRTELAACASRACNTAWQLPELGSSQALAVGGDGRGDSGTGW